jgi:drug/metabolite transporter (DMT)-like permease
MIGEELPGAGAAAGSRLARPAWGDGPLMWDAIGIVSLSIYGINITVVKLALRHVGVLTFTSARWLMAGCILLVVSAASRRGREAAAPVAWKKVAIAALVGVVINQIAFSEAVHHTTATDVALIVGATPLVVALWATLATDERMSRAGWLVLLLGGAGICLVILGGIGGGGSRHLSGDLMAVLTLVSWAAYIVIVSKLLATGDSVRLCGLVSVLGGGVLLVCAAPEIASRPPHLTLELVGLFAFSSVIATALATSCYYAALRRLGSTRLAAFQYIQPFVGAVTAWIVLGEHLTLVQIGGGAIVIAALWRTPRRRQPTDQLLPAPTGDTAAGPARQSP